MTRSDAAGRWRIGVVGAAVLGLLVYAWTRPMGPSGGAENRPALPPNVRPPETSSSSLTETRGARRPGADSTGRTGELCGSIQTTDPDSAPGAIRLSLERFDSQGRVQTVASDTPAADGAFRFENLAPAAAYWLRVRAPKRPDLVLDAVEVRGGQITDLGIIRLEGGRALSGSVMDENGAPVDDARVTLQKIVQVGPRTTTVTDVTEARTGKTGAFQLPGIAPGRYHAIVEKAGYARKSLYGLEVAGSGPPPELTFTLVRSTR